LSSGQQEAKASKAPDRGFYGSAVITLEPPGHFFLRRRLAEAVQELDEGRGSKDSLAAFEVLDGEPGPFPRNQEVGASDEHYFRLEVMLLTVISQAYSGAVADVFGVETSTCMTNFFLLTGPLPDFLRARLPRRGAFAISPPSRMRLF
jgi:hypothetical protein